MVEPLISAHGPVSVSNVTPVTAASFISEVTLFTLESLFDYVKSPVPDPLNATDSFPAWLLGGLVCESGYSLDIAYPRQLRPAQLAGTGLVQAIPLVATATLGHLLYGEVHLAAATSLLLGALPGVYLGARLSTRGPAAVIRPLIVVVLLASGLALLKVPTPLMIVAALAGLVTTVLLRVPQPVQAIRQPDPVAAE